MTASIGPSTYGPLDRVLASTRSLQDQYEVLQQQTVTGRVSQSYAGLASTSSQVLDLAAVSSQGAAYAQAIGYTQGKASVIQGVLTQINGVASGMAAASLGIVGTSSSAAIQGVAEQARLALQQIASLMNSKYAGDYVFAGADTSNPPVPSAETITGSGMFTQIGAQVAALATVPTVPLVSTVIANTVAIASSAAPGTTVFSAYLTGAGATANAVTVQISDFQQVILDLPANRNVGAVSEPAIAGTGNAMSDIIRSLSVIANATDAMTANPDFATLMKDTARTLTSAAQTVSEEAGHIGLAQNTMTTATAAHTSLKMILDKQLSVLTDVDMASAISRLQTVSTQLQASYKILSLARSLNLASFL